MISIFIKFDSSIDLRGLMKSTNAHVFFYPGAINKYPPSEPAEEAQKN